MGKRKQNKIVRKSNLLIRSPWTVMSIWEPRLVGLLASKIHADDKEFKIYRISMKELVEGAGQERWGKAYREIEEAVEKMLSKPLKLYGEDGSITICGIFSKCKIIPKEGVIELSFVEELMPHYLELKERFTQYAFEEFMRLSSIYSQRMFEILSSWKNMPAGEVVLSMDTLHEQLDTPPSLQKDFKAFRIRVLEQAKKDILNNQDSSLNYEWEPMKKEGGRKVTAVRFIFNEQKIAAIRHERAMESKQLREKHEKGLRELAELCSKEMASFPESEQDIRQREQKKEVCDFCDATGIAKTNLFPLECKKYAKIEILSVDEWDGNSEIIETVESPTPLLVSEISQESKIIEAYLSYSNGKFGGICPISSLNQYLKDITRDNLGKILEQMHRDGKCELRTHETPQMMPLTDQKFPIMLDGTPRHVMCIENMLN